jgi:Holliday junction resolvase
MRTNFQPAGFQRIPKKKTHVLWIIALFLLSTPMSFSQSSPSDASRQTSTRSATVVADDDYCVPSGGDATRYFLSVNTENAITNLNVTGIVSPPANGYATFLEESQVITVDQGSTFTFKTTGKEQLQYCRYVLYADWNGDKDFVDSGETIASGGKNRAADPSVVSLNIPIIVPRVAATEASRIRIRIRYFDAWTSDPGPCGVATNGYAADFALQINSRAKATDATLSALSVNNGTLTPAFDPDVTAYTVTTRADSITIGAATADIFATVSGNGTKALAVGENTLQVIGTAEDGVTTKTYTIVVTRVNNAPNATPFTENFETSGATWVIENGSQTNKWFVGGATYHGEDENGKSIYISNTNGATNAYEIFSATGISHFYIDVALSANKAGTLSFNWKGKGQVSADYLNVYAVEPSVVPVAGTLPSGGTHLGTFLNSDGWQDTTKIFPAPLSGTVKRLIFSWINNQNTGTQPPVAIDNISVVDRTKNTDATLKSLSVNKGTLTPAFAADVFAYTLTTAADNITIGAVATDPFAAVSSGTGRKTLTLGENTLPVTVTAEDGTTQTYTIVVTREDITRIVPFTENFDSAEQKWVIENGSQTNKWFVGEATYYGEEESGKSAYISNDNGVTNTYTITATSTSHFYIDVELPANKAGTLSFDWKGKGQINADNLNVYAVEFSDSQDAGTLPTGTLLGTFQDSIAWNRVTKIFPAPLSGTIKRLVFTWKNNQSTGTQPPVAIDNISVVARDLSSDATLSALSVNNGTLTPAFAPTTTEYTVSTGSDSITIVAFSSHIFATVSGTGTKALELGENTFPVTVVAEDGTTQTYTIVVTREDITRIVPFTENFESSSVSWAIENGSQTNKWYVGSATYQGNSGKSAYISNDNGVTNAYTLDQGSTSHFYRDVVFPESTTDYQLSFDWKGMGEPNASNPYDYLRVSLVDTTVTPVAGILIDAIALATYVNQPVWQKTDIIIPAASYSGTTKRLVFSWRNDNISGQQSPAAIDNISLVAKPETGSIDATLRVLSVNNGTLTPAFDPATTEYTVSTGSGSIIIQAVADPLATVDGAGTKTLELGVNTFPVTVTAEDNTVTKTYTIVVTREDGLTKVVPFTEDFESSSVKWVIENGSQPNKWYVGAATYHGESGKSIYISNTNGATNQYDILASNLSHFYSNVDFTPSPTGYLLSFNWKGQGQANLDYLMVYLADTTAVTPVAGSSPAGTRIGGTYQGLSEWQQVTLILPPATYSETTKRLIFSWTNNQNTGTQPPAAIDNISIVPRPIYTVANLSALSVNNGTLTPAFDPATTEYTVSTGSDSIAIAAAVATDSYATVTSGTGTKALTLGANTLEVVVTAEDGETTKKYTIVVTRENITHAVPFSEDFESSTLSWAIENGSQGNKWYVGAATYQGESGKSIYISNTNGATNNYVLNQASTSHFYRDVVFTPSSTEYLLNFDWKGVGQATNVDYLRVSLADPLVTPVAGTQVEGTVLGSYRGQAQWQSATVTLATETYSGTTKRLVFSWINNASSGTQTPSAIDNISITSTGIAVSIANADAKAAVIYPNPVRDYLVIEHAAAQSVQIYAIDGQKLYENPNPSDKEIIPVAGWKKGLYIVKIQTDKGAVSVEKIIKE